MAWHLTTRPIRSTGLASFQINLTTDAFGDERFTPGTKVQVIYSPPAGEDIAEPELVTAEGTIQSTGMLSGMASIFKDLGLQAGDRLALVCEVSDSKAQTAKITEIIRRDRLEEFPQYKVDEPVAAMPAEATRSVLDRFNARHIHFEMYKPELWADWTPAAEVDVYLAFGALQEYTEFAYCCGLNTRMLRELGILDQYRNAQNGPQEGVPDALFIDRTTNEYLIAEFKVNSSAFRINHTRDMIDVLVCWIDDETKRELLPTRVLVLRDTAREAQAARLADEEDAAED